MRTFKHVAHPTYKNGFADFDGYEKGRLLYKEYGFQPLPTEAMRMFISIATNKRMFD
ncbi:GCN5-like N-acetyltransferase [Rhizobium grahamii]|uniref:GCN5-like N-acetyltransferase n=1 Tax=Rhizobium grahamii TaxID=1120045 RepID=A0A370KIR2_9HYPH|nr:GCN5-like N-acetyltransferase [Rhizobium grahamii]